MNPLYTIRDALSAFFSSPLRKWSSVFLLAVLALGGAYYYQIQSLGKVQAAYTIANSARFISGNSDYLSKTPSASNRKTWTFSAWVKRGTLSTDQVIFGAYDNAGASDATYTAINLAASTNALVVSGWSTNWRITNAVFRDPAKWYHLVVAMDTTQATAANRVRVYVDGVEVTSFSTSNNPTLNQDLGVNSNEVHSLGRINYLTGSGPYYFDGYLSDAYFIDGQALDPTSFGATDSNGYWRPKSYTGTYGTNGFKLAFGTGSALGTDTSGNANNWATSTNMTAATSQLTDSPTNSFATWSSINVGTNYGLLAGNLQSSNTGNNAGVLSSTAIPSGSKVYFEYTTNNVCAGGLENYIGITKTTVFPDLASANRGDCGISANSYCYYNGDGQKKNSGSLSAYGDSWCTDGDVIGVATDLVSNKVWFSKNGTWQASGDPAAGTNAAFTVTTGDYFVHDGYGGTATAGQLKGKVNFGQGGQSGLTYDSASGGTFKYTPPSGFKALSTNNLTAPTIAVPKNYFDAITYQGSGVARTVATSLFIATSTGTTTWMVPVGVTSVDYLVVAGGGGGGSSLGGGGGSGGVRTGTLSVTAGTSYTVTVGGGGTAGTGANVNGGNGGDSVFSTITSTGGGGGGNLNNSGNSGGSGGGAGRAGSGSTAGTGTAGQGNDGGTNGGFSLSGGGGGGAGAVGSNSPSSNVGGAGGNGVASSITGSSVTYGGGGGGGTDTNGTPGAGGSGGGGAGTATQGATAGTANTGGGGGGGGGTGGTYAGGAGGSGIVIVSYTPNDDTIGFTPDLVWIKDRTSALMHNIFDSVRSVYAYWSSNSSAAETGGFGQTLTAFLSNGFSLGTNSLFNTSGNNYISWLWKESTTSKVDVVTYTGTGAAQTVAHSLGVAPDFMIVKRRDGTGSPAVYHSSNTSAPATDYLLLDSTAATADDDTYWNDTAPTASVFSVKSATAVNTSGATYVAYLFASTTGFSSFGTYTGNGSADGPFVYTGFKPRYVMIKWTNTAGGDWNIIDTARSSYNPVSLRLFSSSNSADASDSPPYIDVLSNGFKLRASTNGFNGSGNSYIYAAFAEIPFKYSSAVSDVGSLSIASSTRFISGNSDYVNKTPAGASNRTTFTISFWMKQGILATGNLFSAGTTNSDTGRIQFAFSGNQFQFDAFNWYIRTAASYRDPAAWQHVVVSVDTTQATAANRMKIYVDGVDQSIVVSSYPSQSTALAWDDAVVHNIGRLAFNSSGYYDGYLSDFYNIDGQALTPSSFGEYDTSGYWRPKTYSGTYGTNGFHLPLMGTSTAAGIGIDTSGNNNTWTVNNIATTDFVSDSPTNSFATGNPLQPSSGTLTQGNLVSSGLQRATFFPTTGKWYWEVKANAVSVVAGIITDSGTAVTTSVSNGTTMGFEFDADAGTLATTTDGSTFIGTVSNLTGGRYPYATGASNTFNFGQGGQSGLTYDSASGGTFKYTPPSGYKALSTANLPTPSVTIPKNYFDAATYTGSGTATSTWSGFVAFQPDIVWIKDRTSANAHGIFASSTVLYPAWASNATTPEGGAGGTALSAFLSNGFSLGASTTVNTSGDNYISWMWKESPTAGMDIVTYTGDNTSNRTISHSLGVAPDFAIVKRRDSATTGDPYVWHNKLTGAAYFLKLDTTAAQSNTAPPWGTGGWTSSTFMVSNGTENINVSGGTYVAYLFASTTGFSAFGTYTGNAAADGPFVYTGFKPRFVMIKSSTATDAWLIYDTARDTYNVSGTTLVPNTAAADATISGIDFLSNGFKLRTITTTPNAAQTYIYAAFADVPFYYSAQPAATAATTFVAAIAFLLGMTF